MNESLNVKVGDIVLLTARYSERLAKVTKITPTGRIRVENCSCQFDKFGFQMGGDTWANRYRILIPTDDDIARIRKNNAKSKALSLMEKLCKTDEITYEQAVGIIRILEGEENE